MQLKHIHLALALVVTAAIGAWAMWGHRGGGAQDVGHGTAEADPYQALLDAQARQDERLDRLESMLARIGDVHGVPSATDDASAGLPSLQHGSDEHDTPAQDQTRYQQAQRRAEAGFAAEPISSAWASRHEKMISDAFSMESLAAKRAPKPRLYDAQCRSSTCRIELVYADARTAEEGQLFLLHDIGGTLGKSRPFQRTLPDGSVHLIMYSTALRRP